MRTFAARQNDLNTRRYDDTNLNEHVDGLTKEGAKQILVSAGGRKAAKRAIAQLHQASLDYAEGWLVSAKLSAPTRVLQALVMVGVVEQNQTVDINSLTRDDYIKADKDWVWKFRLSALGRAVAKEQTK